LSPVQKEKEMNEIKISSKISDDAIYLVEITIEVNGLAIRGEVPLSMFGRPLSTDEMLLGIQKLVTGLCEDLKKFHNNPEFLKNFSV
jgi:hypothetical protein